MNKGEPSISSRAWGIYQKAIRAEVEPEHKGEYLVINVETSEYEVGPDQIEVMKRAAAKYPAQALFAMRVGHLTMGKIGGEIRVVPTR